MNKKYILLMRRIYCIKPHTQILYIMYEFYNFFFLYDLLIILNILIF